jgi:hypothetical protein
MALQMEGKEKQTTKVRGDITDLLMTVNVLKEKIR